ncbi:hypothetical protein AMAG_09691 [Allomyces macrogynus ATCC 38327]|uniref:Uncharacterized protein n=1 Tax=Allomyces macrogynus (strain ATCC 38327) TaxID=578462 RepID=A0A0L0SSZ3_ALLM3|nr:hypothetical protein, variant [Allomyces macrogynus ATCC 38327]KNE65709.1 hypothetical protein AMAG_09691 [Allomyces macrogynus ATCC 38327]|eukprot:KNE65708.1 hypothetical protein, variant [Allomyces macrogynus ATCC 38327]
MKNEFVVLQVDAARAVLAKPVTPNEPAGALLVPVEELLAVLGMPKENDPPRGRARNKYKKRASFTTLDREMMKRVRVYMKRLAEYDGFETLADLQPPRKQTLDMVERADFFKYVTEDMGLALDKVPASLRPETDITDLVKPLPFTPRTPKAVQEAALAAAAAAAVAASEARAAASTPATAPTAAAAPPTVPAVAPAAASTDIQSLQQAALPPPKPLPPKRKRGRPRKADVEAARAAEAAAAAAAAAATTPVPAPAPVAPPMPMLSAPPMPDLSLLPPDAKKLKLEHVQVDELGTPVTGQPALFVNVPDAWAVEAERTALEVRLRELAAMQQAMQLAQAFTTTPQ